MCTFKLHISVILRCYSITFSTQRLYFRTFNSEMLLNEYSTICYEIKVASPHLSRLTVLSNKMDVTGCNVVVQLCNLRD